MVEINAAQFSWTFEANKSKALLDILQETMFNSTVSLICKPASFVCWGEMHRTLFSKRLLV